MDAISQLRMPCAPAVLNSRYRSVSSRDFLLSCSGVSRSLFWPQSHSFSFRPQPHASSSRPQSHSFSFWPSSCLPGVSRQDISSSFSYSPANWSAVPMSFSSEGSSSPRINKACSIMIRFQKSSLAHRFFRVIFLFFLSSIKTDRYSFASLKMCWSRRG